MTRKCITMIVACFFASISGVFAVEGEGGFDQKMDDLLKPAAELANEIIFYSLPMCGANVPIVLLLLAGTAIFLTIYFGFINLRGFGLAVRTVKGKYSSSDDPGQITHFQALSTAVSATVGLGNIAGVAIAISLGGPGAVFWMIVMGFLGMTSKFAECTLGVKYRMIDAKGRANGGGMYYLRDGLKERGLPRLGKVLAAIFAVACIGGAIGAGNMFQVNQAHEQVSETFGIFNGASGGVVFGVIVAIAVGLVILGGIVSIAKVTGFLVPFMCITYLIACVIVLAGHIAELPAAIGTIVTSAFDGSAVAGGLIISLIQGIKRGVFSNEAGVGSAAMAHAAVKTKKPASEGIVALLEPFIDTIVVCSMTALVVIVTGMWKVNSDVKVESLDVVATLGGDIILQTYQEGDHLNVKSQWQALQESENSWVNARASLEDENITIIDESGAEQMIKSDALSLENLGPVWAEVVNPKNPEEKGFVPMASLNDRSKFSGGIWMTSQAFQSVISWFPYVLAIAVFLFAFSTLISWSYYGEQAVAYLFNGSSLANIAYKLIFCVFVVIGSSASLNSVLDLSDAMFFAMVVPNLIGLYLLLPVAKSELKKFREHAASIDAEG